MPDAHDMLSEILEHNPDDGRRMTDWELDFVESAQRQRCSKFGLQMTPNRLVIITRIWNKVCR